MSRPTHRSVRPREEEDVVSEASEFDSQHGDSDAESQGTDNEDEDDQTSSQSSPPSEDESDPESQLKDLSFGVLAEAQAKLACPLKRKASEISRDAEETPRSAAQQYREHQDQRLNDHNQRPTKPSRASKHAPAMLSSKTPVSRKRQIFSPPPSEKSRDPRFDASIASDSRRGNFSSSISANRNYAFLNDYQASEVLALKAQIKKAKDPDEAAQLKRKAMSIEAKLRNAQVKTREEDILREHKRAERQAIREGKKSRPYYLKESEVKKQIARERTEGLSKRARDKAEKRKKMREKSKDAKGMPRQRRMVGEQ